MQLRLLAVVALSWVGAGCKTAAPFQCVSSDECTPGGLGGYCEADGYCSFPDSSCPSGRRYGDFAGDKSLTCVGGGGDDASSDVDAAVIPDGSSGDARPPDGPTGDAPEGGCIVEGDGCLALPTDVVTVSENGTDFDADFSCAPFESTPSAQPIDFSGIVVDEDGLVADADLKVYRDYKQIMLLGSGNSGGDGDYTLSTPAGTPSIVHWRIEAPGHLDSYYLFEFVAVGSPTQDDTDWTSFTDARLDALADEAGVVRDPAFDTVFADAFDCDGNGVEHVIGLVSSTSGRGPDDTLPTLVEGTTAIYIDDLLNLAPRSERTESNDDGHFYIFNVPDAGAGETYYLQYWGYVTDDALTRGAYGLTLLAEYELITHGSSHIRIQMPPTEGPL